MSLSPDDLLDDTPRRAELLAEVEPYRQAGQPWTHVGGYLGRSIVLRSGDAVLKCFFHAAESKWQRELRAYAFLTGTGLPVPRLLASGRLVDQVPWLVMTAAPGVIAADILDELPASERTTAFAAMGALLARLHTLAVDERLTGEAVADARNTYFARLARRLGENGERAMGITHRRAVLAIARSWAVDLLHVCPSTLVCTHGDFSPRNLLLEHGATGWTLSGLIDFERCEYGDAAMDLARVLIAQPRWASPELAAFLAAYEAIAPLVSRERLLLQLAAIVLDAATWAERRDRAYYDHLLDLVERIDRDPDALPAAFPREPRLP